MEMNATDRMGGRAPSFFSLSGQHTKGTARSTNNEAQTDVSPVNGGMGRVQTEEQSPAGGRCRGRPGTTHAPDSHAVLPPTMPVHCASPSHATHTLGDTPVAHLAAASSVQPLSLAHSSARSEQNRGGTVVDWEGKKSEGQRSLVNCDLRGGRREGQWAN